MSSAGGGLFEPVAGEWRGMNSSEHNSVANRLFFRLFQTGNTLQRQVQNEMGVSTVQWAVLGALSREGYEQGISFNMLTEYLVVSRQSLDGVINMYCGCLIRMMGVRGWWS